MEFEKSCGAVVYYIDNNQIEFLIIRQVKGHWSFPKGHVENNETDAETALREIKEETGLEVELNTNFQKSCIFSPREGVLKENLFFVALANSKKVVIQEKELTNYKWLMYEEALALVTHSRDKDVLKEAYEFIKKESK